MSRTLDRIRRLAARPGPHICSVEGRLGLSSLAPVLEATEPGRRVVYAPPALTDAENLEALVDRLSPLIDGPSRPATWSDLFSHLPSLAPLTLVIHRPSGVTAVNRRFWRDLGSAWHAVRRAGQRIHIFLVEDARGLGATLNQPESPLRDPDARLRPGTPPSPVDIVTVEPGSHYDLGAAVPRWMGRDLLLAWALFGGLPDTWAGIPRNGGPVDALRLALSTPGSRLLSNPMDWLERRVQTPNRYASILRAVAKGARSWRDVSGPLARTSSNRSASGPYLARLQELGHLVVDRPLGARQGGRRSRYRMVDPHERLWWSLIHPHRIDIVSGSDPSRVWAEALRPKLDDAFRNILPQICLNFLRHGSESTLGATAREAGPLWGDGFDIPVAATLANGAVCYGHVHTGSDPAPLSVLALLERGIGETRYGYGRQARIRLVFSASGFTAELGREAARREMVRLVGTEELIALPG